MCQFRMRRAVEADVPAMSETYFKAFSNSLITQKCFPPAYQSSHEWMQNYLSEGMKGESAHVWVVVDDSVPSPDGLDGYVVGFAKWVGPRPGGLSQKDEGGEDRCPVDGNMILAKEFFAGMHQGHVDIMGGEEHWFLSLIGVRPEAQGQGAARMLLQWGLQEAENAGMRVFLDATEDGRPVYEKYGFREVRQMHFANGTVKQTCMIREAPEND